MRSYGCFYWIKNGLLVGSMAINCTKDREAIAAAEREARKCEYVELGKGSHPVASVSGL
jgi:hypothetical protein